MLRVCKCIYPEKFESAEYIVIIILGIWLFYSLAVPIIKCSFPWSCMRSILKNTLEINLKYYSNTFFRVPIIFVFVNLFEVHAGNSTSSNYQGSFQWQWTKMEFLKTSSYLEYYCIWNTFQIIINHFYSNAYDLYGFLTSLFLYSAKLFVRDVTYLK